MVHQSLASCSAIYVARHIYLFQTINFIYLSWLLFNQRKNKRLRVIKQDGWNGRSKDISLIEIK